MSEKQIDAVFFSSEDNVLYYGGAKSYELMATFARPLFFLLPRQGEPTLIIHKLFEETTRRKSPIRDIRTYADASTPTELIIDFFKEYNLRNGIIGVEMGEETRIGMPLDAYNRITKSIPDSKFVDASDIIWRQRMVKSESEISFIRKSCEILDKAYQKTQEKIHKGMMELDVDRIHRENIVSLGAEKPGFVIMNSSPENYNVFTGAATTNILREDNLLWIDSGAVYNGYWSDTNRNFAIGTLSDKQIRTYKITLEATKKLINLIKPGLRVCDIITSFNEYSKKMGLTSLSSAGRIGHSLGIIATEPPHLALYDKTILEPGMVVTPEPTVITDHGLYQTEVDVVITEDGCEQLSTPLDDLPVI